ncbi:uncharacterized protein LOC131215572 [Anopheles bellator]|uniref:uncharacterized protein LOC131215572 n=1 Tax=Anopheles bellator TaxID=139047 RepID=UPI002647FA05|nr:uncharacterized protein LOC131215572 [Anopheles bellator]
MLNVRSCRQLDSSLSTVALLLLAVNVCHLSAGLASPTTAYDSFDSHGRGLLPVRAESPAEEPHGDLSLSAAADETPRPVQQQLLGAAGSVTRVPWYGLTEVTDIVLLAALVAVAVIGAVVFVVLVISLRTKFQTLRAQHSQQRAGVPAERSERSAVKGESKTKAPQCKGPPIVLIETVKPVSVTCVTVKRGCETYEPPNSPPPLTRPRIEQPLSLSDKHADRTVATVPRKQHPPPEAVTMSALGTTLESTNQLPSPVPAVTTNLVGDDKENCLQPQSTCDSLSQHHPSNQRATANVLKRQPVAEISLASSGPPTASPTAFIQLLTPSSASSISTTTTDNNATPTKTGATGGPGGPLSASESMAAARFGFSPRSIHSFTVQTATYFRFPDVDDFTPTPRTTLHPKPAIDDDGSSSTPPAVDAFTDPAERDDSMVVPLKQSTHSTPPAPPAPPSIETPEQEKGQVEVEEEPVAAPATADDPVAPEGRATSRICAPMANRRVRLKSISLDSEGARLVEENLTSTIPVQELVGMAQQRGGGGTGTGTTRFDCVLDDVEDDVDESNNYETDGEGWPRTKRVRNILNLRLNIPPLGGGSGPSGTLPLAIGSQSTGSMVETTATMVSRSVTTSVSNPAMIPTHHQHQPSSVLAAASHHQHQQRPELESNEQFYFEYFDYGDDDDDETDDEYDEDGEEFEDNNNNNTNHSHGSRARPPALPTAPKTPTLSQSKQKASSLDSDSKVKISVPYGVGGGAGSVSCSAGLSIMSIAQSTSGGGPGTTLTYSQQQPQYQQQQGHVANHFQQQPAQHQGQLQPRRVSSASVPTTPKRYQYRTAVNHHYHQYHHHHQQQQQQTHYPSGQSKLMKAAYDGLAPGGAPPPPTPAIARKDKSPIVGGTKSGANDEEETGNKGASTATTATNSTTGRSASILQRRGSNHSLTLNLDIYHRGGSVDLTGSNCSLHRGSYKNLHQAHSQSQLYQQYPDTTVANSGGGAVRVQCHQASPQGGQSAVLPNATHNNNNSHATGAGGSSVSNGGNNNSNKKNLLQRRGSNTSLTLNLRSGVVGGGSTFGLNRFSSHNSLNTTHMTVHGAMGGAPGAGGTATGQQQQLPSSLVRPAGSKKSLLERRNSNASLTLINVHQRTLSVSNCNLRGSICSLNSLLTTHTQNEAGGGMMLEEDELDCTGAATGRHGDDHHNHHHHHQHHQHHQHQQGLCHNGQHHQHHGHHRVLGGRSGLAASVDGGIHETDGGAVGTGAGEQRIGRLTVAASQGNSMDNATSPCGDQDQVDGGHRACHRAGNEYRHERQRKFRSSDSLHNINTREHCLSLQQPQPHRERHLGREQLLTEAKLMATGSYQRCCQSSYDERHLYGSSENFKQQQNKLSTHRALFHKDPSIVTSASSANNLSALGTSSLACCCCCCCCCCAAAGGVGGAGDGCCDANGLIVKTGNLSISNSNIRNISTKPLSPQTTSEDFKIYLANIQFLQNASNVLTIAYLRKLHNFFTKTYRKMVTAAKDNRRPSKDQTKEPSAASTAADGGEDRCGGPKMMLMHSDSLHHPPVCDDESYDEEHKKMVLKIHQEFWDLPTNYQEKPLVFGSQAKNRYKTILPNEHSRVILEPERAASIAGEPYINANFIKGPDYANNSYIATQGPLPNTVYEFWLMVHQNIVRTAAATARCPPSPSLEQKIVMLTNFVENGRQKCAIYFPQNEADWLAFGCTADVDISGVLEARNDIEADTTSRSRKVRVRCASCFFLVQNVCVEQRNGYTVRTLKITHGSRCSQRTKDAAVEDGEELADFELSHFRAQHYWFPDWPDHRSPNDINVLLDLSLDVLGTEHTRTNDDALLRADPSSGCIQEPPETPCVSKGDSVATGVVLPIIHCSAGIGRTGCLIAILNGLRQLRLSVLAHRRNAHKQLLPEALLSPSLAITDGPAIEQDVQLAPEKTNPSDDVPAQTVQDTTDAIHSEEESELEKSIPLPPVPSGRRCIGGGGNGSLQRESGQVDILGIVCNLRLQRGGMVQNSEQYELIHRALCLYLEKLTREEPA